MQVERLPKRVCETIEKIQRNFIWGHDGTSRKTHVANWNFTYNPKSVNGLGFKRIKQMNYAYLIKLYYKICFGDVGLWIKVLHGKYEIGVVGLKKFLVIQGTQSSSVIW